MKIAIVGAGIAGLGAARALAAAGHAIDILEAAPRAGGHVHTVAHAGHAIDMGFIVCNRERYPLFFRLLDELGVATRPTTMSFSVSLPRTGIAWSTRMLGGPRDWPFVAAVVGFLRRARRDLDAGIAHALSLDEYVAHRRLSRELRDRFVIPLAAALWSLAPDRCGAFPAETYLRFLEQHGMLRALRPLAWRTIAGGSQRYLDALLATLPPGALHTASPVARIARDRTGITAVVHGRERRYDRVVIATHADTALALLDAPTEDERRVLGAFRYSTNETVLHRDERFLPRDRRAHAAWNYVEDPDTARVAVTYSMAILQGVPYLVTLNPRTPPADSIARATFAHPQFDRAALDAQAELPRLAGAQRTYYAGAHFGFGFHEDGLRSGLAAAARALADEAGA